MNWDSLIKILTAGKIIPVIGNDLIRVKNKDRTFSPLYHYIARELTQTLNILNTPARGSGNWTWFAQMKMYPTLLFRFSRPSPLNLLICNSLKN
ncbi:MAG: hypothetical protein MUF15_04595 [Acidobacteria bacterium]|jgi:hypothetical protein|nr:hypothetical protein [Acidobacteriota bacterium]